MPILISSMPGDSLRISSTCLTTLLGFRHFLKRTLKQVFLSWWFLIRSDWSCVATATWVQFQSLVFGLLALRRDSKFWTSTYLLQDPNSLTYAPKIHQNVIHFCTPLLVLNLVAPHMWTESELVLFHHIWEHKVNDIDGSRYGTRCKAESRWS